MPSKESGHAPHWTSAKPATQAAIRQLVKLAGVELPADYLAFLRKSGGGEGELGILPEWIMLWPAQEVIAANRDYCVPEFLPGFFAFGSSGGGEMFAFDFRQPGKVSIVMVPFIPMDADEAICLAPTFTALAKHFGKSLTKPAKKAKTRKAKTKKGNSRNS